MTNYENMGAGSAESGPVKLIRQMTGQMMSHPTIWKGGVR